MPETRFMKFPRADFEQLMQGVDSMVWNRAAHLEITKGNFIIITKHDYDNLYRFTTPVIDHLYRNVIECDNNGNSLLIREATPEEAKVNNGIILMIFYHRDYTPRTIGPFDTPEEALQEAEQWEIEVPTKIVYGRKMSAKDLLNEAQIASGVFSVAEFSSKQRRLPK